MNRDFRKAIAIFLESNKEYIAEEYRDLIYEAATKEIRESKIDSEELQNLIYTAIVDFNIEPLAAIQYAIEKIGEREIESIIQLNLF
ncbi:MAG: hypothetical protein QNJ54_25605 [Prochloraceae cyanobacterium]|nr:hypothetical protein [Prochloraceae cyanobacterium]